MSILGFPGGTSGKESTCQYRRHQEIQVQFLDQEDPLEKEMTSYSNILAGKIPQTEQPEIHGVSESDMTED